MRFCFRFFCCFPPAGQSGRTRRTLPPRLPLRLFHIAQAHLGGLLLFGRDYKDASGEWLTEDDFTSSLASYQAAAAIPLFIGSDDAIRNAFAVEPKDNMVFLPGVMSRKKQVIPMLTTLWG